MTNRLFVLVSSLFLGACGLLSTPSTAPTPKAPVQEAPTVSVAFAAPLPITPPTLTAITICPESNFDLTPMVWPNLISVLSTVDGHGYPTTTSVEIDTQSTFATAETYEAVRGNINAVQATTGPVKVGRHISGLTPDTGYFVRFRAANGGGVRYSPVLAVKTPAQGVLGTPVNLVFDSVDSISPTEIRPYWRGEGHNGKRFAWKYEWFTNVELTSLLGSYTGFYDGPSQSVGTDQPRAEFNWTLLDLPSDAMVYVRLSSWNRGGYSESVKGFKTLSAAGWTGAVDQKSASSLWGWLHSDPRDMSSPLISATLPMEFGADLYDGNHSKVSTTGEDAYTVYVDHTGITKMWLLGQPGAFTASSETGKTSNIAKAVRSLKGVGGIVRVAYDNGATYNGGDYGGLANATTVRAPTSEAYWDNGLAVSNPLFKAYPLSYVRIQAADVSKKPVILNGIGIQDSHGGANGLYFYGFNFRNAGSNASSVMFPGYASGGMIGFYKCRFDVSLTSGAYNGYGVKWHIKATGAWAFDIRDCDFTPAREHSAYLNAVGSLGNVDTFLLRNRVLNTPGLNSAGMRANGRTMFQTDSRGDHISYGNAPSLQTGLAPGRGTIWFIGNIACNGGDDGGKGLSIPGHWGKIVVDDHLHLADPLGDDFGFMNTVEDPQKGAWLNADGFAVGEVEIRKVSWNVTNTIANMYICNGTETVRILERPGIVMNNRVAFAFSEVTIPPFPRSVGMVEMSWAGTADDALRTDSAWPANLSPDNKVRHEFSTQINSKPVFDDSAAGKANFNTLSKGFVFAPIQ